MYTPTNTARLRAPTTFISAPRRAPTHPSIAFLLGRFAPISLAGIDAVALQNRTDIKYVLSIDVIIAALAALADQYRVLEINALRQSPYQTLYFDTPDFGLYMSHHAGRTNRFKVRSRRYVGTDQSFIEVKLKTNKDRTVKQRIPTDTFTTGYTPELVDFIASQTNAPVPDLEPKLWNEFTRITLAGERERVTIDLDLRFRGNGECVALPGIAIVEVKQSGVSRNSAFIQQLHAAGAQPSGFSKYCVGVALLYPEVKHNRFKPKLLLVQKLMGETGHVY